MFLYPGNITAPEVVVGSREGGQNNQVLLGRMVLTRGQQQTNYYTRH